MAKMNSAAGARTPPPIAPAEPDLVDRIFDYLVELSPEIAARVDEVKQAVRDDFSGATLYIKRRRPRHELAVQVLSLFNGRNASEVARRLHISRATVYRIIKQPGQSVPAAKSSQVSET